MKAAQIAGKKAHRPVGHVSCGLTQPRAYPVHELSTERGAGIGLKDQENAPGRRHCQFSPCRVLGGSLCHVSKAAGNAMVPSRPLPYGVHAPLVVEQVCLDRGRLQAG